MVALSGQGAELRIGREGLPGRPDLWPDAYSVRPGEPSAEGRIALRYRPVPSGDRGPTLSDEGYYLVFFRHVIAFDVRGQLRWCRALEHDIVELVQLASTLAAQKGLQERSAAAEELARELRARPH